MNDLTIGLVCTLISVTISYLTFCKNNKKDIKSDTQEQVELRAKLDYISKGIDDIKFNDRIRDEELKKINERVIIVEEKVKVLYNKHKSNGGNEYE